MRVATGSGASPGGGRPGSPDAKRARKIYTLRHLEALYREGAIEISEPTRDAELLPTQKELDKILRQERMLELEY